MAPLNLTYNILQMQLLSTLFDQRSILTRIKDVFLAVLWELKHYIEMPFRVLYSLCSPVKKYHTFGESVAFKKKADALCVLVHGLLAHPAGLDKHLDFLKKEEGFDVLIPHVPKKGNCALKEAAQPFLDTIDEWIKNNPGKKVALIGHSNGARIACYIEQQMRKTHPDVEVMFVSIAGPHKGTKWINFGKWLGLDKWFLDEAVWKELEYDSDYMAEYLRDFSVMDDRLRSKRRINCFVSFEDETCGVEAGILPMGDIEVLHGVGHNAMMDHVAEKVHALVKKWVYSVE